VQPVHLAPQSLDTVALKPISEQQHDGALRENAAGPIDIEAMERGGDARAARPILHLLRATRQRLIRITPTQRARDIGEPCAEQKRLDMAALVGERMEKMQKGARIFRH